MGLLFDVQGFSVHDGPGCRTGVSNDVILENTRRLASHDRYRLIFRMTVVPGFNDSRVNIKRTAEFLRSIQKTEINVLPLHHLGAPKYDSLGLQYNDRSLPIPQEIDMHKIKQLYEECGVTCYVDASTPF